MMVKAHKIACALVMVLSLGIAGAAAQAAEASGPQVNTAAINSRVNEEVGVDVGGAITKWQHELDGLDSEIRGPRPRYSELSRLRNELQRIRSELADFAGRLQAPFDAVKAQLDLLGPAPAAGQPREPDSVALNRAELNYHLGVLSAAQATVNSAELRIDQLINTIQDIRRKNFTTELFQPVPGIYSSQTWARLPDRARSAADRLVDLVSGWWNDVRDKAEVERIALEAILLGTVLALAGWYGTRRMRTWPGEDDPPFLKRISAATGVILLRAVPAVVAIVFAYLMVAEAQPLPERVDWLFTSLAKSLIILFCINAFATTVLAPAAPKWRLIPASDRAAARLYGLTLALLVIYASAALIYAATRVVRAPFELTLAVALPSSLVVAALLAAMLLTPLEQQPHDDLPSLRWLKPLHVLVWVCIAAVVVSALSGYLALSRFLAQQMVVTGSILAATYLLLLWVDGLGRAAADDGAPIGRWVAQRVNLEMRRRDRLVPLVTVLLKAAVVVVSVPLIMLQWGYTWPDIGEWYRQLFFGLHIPNTEVSIAALLAATIVFVLAYAAAKLFQGWLDARVLTPAGISGGTRDSIRIGVGYVGVTLAVLIALSYAGFNLSSLAILAGAFSVGIGFGLQSVVNNFVSGLILLAERPIKVGDFVVVGGEEGYVRKISVRSTEVETVDQASVVVPNSYFITEKVKNWTRRNSRGRVVIAVGVAYGCDPREVRAILLKAAQDHPNVTAVPEPAVELEDFGPDSLNFKLYACTHDLTKNLGTRTDLRIAILEALKAAGIQLPQRQTNVAIENLDWLRAAVAEYVSGSNTGKGNVAPATSPTPPQVPGGLKAV
jgi:small-conductance mechanosensitive channel